MERKTTGAYVAVFEELRRLLPNLNIVKAMCDYELALRNALRHVFLEIEIDACFYHYVQVNNFVYVFILLNKIHK